MMSVVDGDEPARKSECFYMKLIDGCQCVGDDLEDGR